MSFLLHLILFLAKNPRSNYNRSLRPMQLQPLESYAKRAGNGFLMGQAFALFGATTHSVFDAPYGSKLHDFNSQFRKLSITNGTNMAQWSIVNMTIEPILEKYIKNKRVLDITGGAVTGAIMDFRNGSSGVLSGAFQGALQSIVMGAIGSAIGVVASPLNKRRQERMIKEFNEGRNNAMFISPFKAIQSAFFNK